MIKEETRDDAFPIEDNEATEDAPPKKHVERRWKWTYEKIDNLLDSVYAFKIKVTSRGSYDFQANKSYFYSEVREMMAAMYPEQDFGPLTPPLQSTVEMTDSQRYQYEMRKQKQDNLIKEGYTRIRNKIKEMRASYYTVLEKGLQALDYKRTILEHFNKIHQIWGNDNKDSDMFSSNPTQAVHSPEERRKQIQSVVRHIESLNAQRTSSETKSVGTGTSHGECPNDEELQTFPKQSSINFQTTKDVTTDFIQTENESLKTEGRTTDSIKMQLANEERQIFRETCEVIKNQAKANTEATRALAQSVSLLGQNIKDGFALLAAAIMQAKKS